MQVNFIKQGPSLFYPCFANQGWAMDDEGSGDDALPEKPIVLAVADVTLTGHLNT